MFQDQQAAILHIHSGEGTIICEDERQIQCAFIFTQHEDGECFISCETNGSESGEWLEPSLHLSSKLIGQTHDGFHLDIKDMTYDGFLEYYKLELNFKCSEALFSKDSNQAPHSITAPITNLDMRCNRHEALVFENASSVTGQQTPFELGDILLTVRPIKGSSKIVNEIKTRRGIAVTCEAIAPVNTIKDAVEMRHTLTIFCSLLTFVYSTKINWTGYDVKDESGTVLHRYCVSLHTSGFSADFADKTWSAFYWIEDQKAFCKQAYENYDKLWDDWEIFAAINLFTSARGQENFPEVTGLQLVSCIELVNAQYINRTKLKKVFKHYDKKLKPKLKDTVTNFFDTYISESPTNLSPDEIQKGKTALENERDYLIDNLSSVNNDTFAPTLKAVCDALGFDVDDTSLERFKLNRNKLVHSGRFHVSKDGADIKSMTARERWDWYGTKSAERWNELRFMEDFVGNLLLSALGCPQKLSGR